MRTSPNSRTRGTASRCARACTPVPRIASVDESGRASSRTDSAEAAAVRIAVIAVPSSSASGRPLAGSNMTITAWWVGSLVLPGKSVTNLLASAPAEGVKPGIAASSPSGSATRAPTRLGTEARPALRSAMALATASIISATSSSSSTSRRLITSTAAAYLGPGVGALRGRQQLAALEAVGPEGLQARVGLAVGDLRRRQPADRQRLEAVTRVHDRVSVLAHPVADRIVVGRVGHDAARGRQLPVGRPAAEAPQRCGQARGEEVLEALLGRVHRVVRPVGVEVGRVEQHRQAAARDPGAGAAHAEVDSPRPVHQDTPVAVRAQRLRLVEVHHRRLAARAARQAGARQRELALLRLPVAQLDLWDQLRRPRAGGEHERLVSEAISGAGDGLAAAELDDLGVLADLYARLARAC